MPSFYKLWISLKLCRCVNIFLSQELCNNVHDNSIRRGHANSTSNVLQKSDNKPIGITTESMSNDYLCSTYTYTCTICNSVTHQWGQTSLVSHSLHQAQTSLHAISPLQRSQSPNRLQKQPVAMKEQSNNWYIYFLYSIFIKMLWTRFTITQLKSLSLATQHSNPT